MSAAVGDPADRARAALDMARKHIRQASIHLMDASTEMPAGGRDRPRDLSEAYAALDNVRDLHEALARYVKKVDSP